MPADEALIEFEQLAKRDSSMLVLGDLSHAYAVSGREKKASKMLSPYLQREPLPSYSIALVHLGLGRRDEALEWPERAFAERSSELVRIKADPRLDPLRSDPRFEDLLRRMKLDDGSLAGRTSP